MIYATVSIWEIQDCQQKNLLEIMREFANVGQY